MEACCSRVHALEARMTSRAERTRGSDDAGVDWEAATSGTRAVRTAMRNALTAMRNAGCGMREDWSREDGCCIFDQRSRMGECLGRNLGLWNLKLTRRKCTDDRSSLARALRRGRPRVARAPSAAHAGGPCPR